MNEIVRVAVPRPIWNTYDYSFPGKDPKPAIGSRVRVALGASNTVGIVVGHPDSSAYELKPVGRVLDEAPLLPKELVKLAAWISEYYHYPLGAVYETMLPVAARRGHGTEFAMDRLWSVVEDGDEKPLNRAKRQRELYELLKVDGPMLDSELRQKAIPRSRIEALFEKKLVKEIPRKDARIAISHGNFDLTAEQQASIAAIRRCANTFQTFLLDGVTGSGKTEVYLQIIADVLERGQQALVLVPEISLTPQIETRFVERFGTVKAMHSMLPDVERFKIWYETATGRNRILIGTRSAVFTPFKNLGVIIVDEEHDLSFKQADGLRYSARDVAIVRAQNLGIPCILGSATPSLEALNNVQNGRFHGLRLSHRPGTAEMPTMHIQDMRGHANTGGICEPLLERMGRHVDADGQVLVLINRRGFLPSYFCTSCGWKAVCEDCDSRLTLHEQPHRMLQCHKCLKQYLLVDSCPDCGKESLIGSGTGTQRIEVTLRQRFPNVNILRVDRDIVRTHRRLTAVFEELSRSNKGIIIGTQMLAKGHHFPNVTMVAVIGADGGFLSTDFRGPERTAQLIVQVAGRAGREERRGEVWIQSFDPENPDLNVLVNRGYRGFIENERKIRYSAKMPPHSHMALIRAEGMNPDATEEFIGHVMDQVSMPGVEKLGPIQAPITRISKRYRYQGALLSGNRTLLHEVLLQLRTLKSGNRHIRWSIDVDPMDMY